MLTSNAQSVVLSITACLTMAASTAALAGKDNDDRAEKGRRHLATANLRPCWHAPRSPPDVTEFSWRCTKTRGARFPMGRTKSR